jgi:hypothetical protein
MNFLKTPQQMLMEDAGLTPASPGMLKTPQQALMEESGIQPRFFSDGGSTSMGVQDMLAELIALGYEPQKFSNGGRSTVKNIAVQTGLATPFLTEDIKNIAKDVKDKKYKEAAVRTGDVAYSALAPWNPLTAFLSGITYSPELGDATLDTYNKQKAAEAARQQEMIRAQARAQSPVFKHNQPVEFIDVREQPSFPSLFQFYNR